MKIAVYSKTMENSRNKIDAKTCEQRKRLFKIDIQNQVRHKKHLTMI